MQQQRQRQQSFEQQQANNNNLNQQQQQRIEQLYNSPQTQIGVQSAHSLSQSVSSSPSSISIITPLMGPPTLQQQQQQQQTIPSSLSSTNSIAQDSQSMMKPIFVLGQPLSERDYSQASTTSSQLYYHHQQQQQHSYPAQSAASASTDELTVGKSSAAPGKSLEPPTAAASAADNQQQQQQKSSQKLASSRIDKSAESTEPLGPAADQMGVSMAGNATAQGYASAPAASANQQAASGLAERITGPPLIYSDGHLKSSLEPGAIGFTNSQHQQPTTNATSVAHQQQQQPSPRLFQGSNGPAQSQANNMGMVMSNTNGPRRPSLPPPVSQANAASGFRSPLSPSGPLIANQPPPTSISSQQQQQQQQLGISGNSLAPSLNNNHLMSQPNFYQNSPPYAGPNTLLSFNPNANQQQQQLPPMGYNAPKQNFMNNQLQQQQQQHQQQHTFPGTLTSSQGQQSVQTSSSSSSSAMVPPSSARRPLNITRVERK